MEIEATDSGLTVSVWQNQESGAQADGFIAYSNIADNRASFGYSFFWGESGTITLTFQEGAISCNIAENDTHPEHGFGSGTHHFVQDSQVAVVDYSGFSGTWGSSGFSWEAGGLCLELSISGGVVNVEMNCVQGPPMNRIATVTGNGSYADISNQLYQQSYSNDGWGNSGFYRLDFSNPNQIRLSVYETNTSSSAMWGFSTQEWTLYRM